MNITNVKIHKLENSKTLALANITIDNDFVVSGLKVLNGQNGYWVAMPNRKKQDGEYQDIAFPVTKEARQAIQDKVLAKFHETHSHAEFSSNEAKQVYEDVKYEPIDVNEEDLPF
jgi:stage V sporulation protein G